ncbi:MAG: ABC transporter ATP-binding protein [Alphaproteobacteria bacterium]|nr:ABC transporter ATP-binding protein [Alphaproteobacteria bacterium]
MSSTLRFARRYMLPFWPWYLGGTAALVATTWLSVTIPMYVAEGVDALAHGGDRSVVLRSAIAVALMGLVIIAVRTLSRVLYFTPGRLVEAALKRDLFAAMLRHQPAFLRRYETGDLFSRVSSDVNMLRLLAGFGVLQVVNAVLAVGFAGGAMARLSPQLTLYLVVPLAVALVVVQVFIQRMFHLMRRLQIEAAALSSHILASYRGVATVQGFVAEDAFADQFDARNGAYLDTMLQQAWIRALLGPTLAFAADVNLFLLLYFGGPMAMRGEITVGELVAFTTLVAYVTRPLRATSFIYSVIKQAQAALERIDAIDGEPADRPELSGPGAVPVVPAPRAPALELRDLHFTYPGGDAPTLQGISLTVPAGGTLGILGLTGSGKTTLLQLVSRMYNPPRGTVFVDGVDVLDLDLDAWRERMTLVPQRPFLFSESMADNILLGADDPERLSRAVGLAALSPDIEALPDGTGTLVGESGVRLSGGQRQRTALARGLVREHHLLLLDDVLSAVDHATETELIGTIRGRGDSGRTTTVIVAHRVSALQHADHVLVLDGGRMVDFGTPAELQARPGPYRDTWQQQQAEGA